MKILIHALAVRQHGGTARHLLSFVPALGRYGTQDEYSLYVDRDARLPSSIPANITVHRVYVRSSLGRVNWDTFHLPQIAQQMQADAIWNLVGFGAFKSPVPQIMFQRAPGYYCRYYLENVSVKTRLASFLRREWQAAIMRRSSQMVTPTAAMRDMIRHCHPDIPEDRFTVLHHAYESSVLQGDLPNHLVDRINSLPENAVKLLYIGHILPYKDLEWLMDVFAETRKHLQTPLYWFLTIAEQDWPEGYQRFMQKRQVLGLEDTVVILGKLPGEYIGPLYRNCDLVLFPSLCESFGWPMLEATSLSKPLLAVDRPLNRELTGKGALYYKVGDTRDAVEKLIKLVVDIKLRSQLGAAGFEHFQMTHVTWAKYIETCRSVTQDAIRLNAELE